MAENSLVEIITHSQGQDIHSDNARYLIDYYVQGNSKNFRDFTPEDLGIEPFFGRDEGGFEEIIRAIRPVPSLDDNGIRSLLRQERELWWDFRFYDRLTRTIKELSGDEYFVENVALKTVMDTIPRPLLELLKAGEPKRREKQASLIDIIKNISRVAELAKSKLQKNPEGLYSHLDWLATMLCHKVEYECYTGEGNATFIVTPDEEIHDLYYQDNLYDDMTAAQLKFLPLSLGLPPANVSYNRKDNSTVFEIGWESHQESVFQIIKGWVDGIKNKIRLYNFAREAVLEARNAGIIWERRAKAKTRELEEAYARVEEKSAEATALKHAFGKDAASALLTSGILNVIKGNYEIAEKQINFALKLAPEEAFVKEGVIKFYLHKLADGENEVMKKLGYVTTDNVWRFEEIPELGHVTPYIMKTYDDAGFLPSIRGPIEFQAINWIQDRNTKIEELPEEEKKYSHPPIPTTEILTVHESERKCKYFYSLIMKFIEAPRLDDLCLELSEGKVEDKETAKEFLKQCRYVMDKYRASLTVDPIELSDDIPIVDIDFAKKFKTGFVENLKYLKNGFSEEEIRSLIEASEVLNQAFAVTERVQFVDWIDTNVLIQDKNGNETLDEMVKAIDRDNIHSYVRDKVAVYTIDFNKLNRKVHPLEDSRITVAHGERTPEEQRNLDINNLLCMERSGLIEERKKATGDEKVKLEGKIDEISEFILDYQNGKIDIETDKDMSKVYKYVPEEKVSRLLMHDAPYVELYRAVRWYNRLMNDFPISEGTLDRERWVDEVNFCLNRMRKSVDQAFIYSGRLSPGYRGRDKLRKISRALDKIGTVSVDGFDHVAIQEPSIENKVMKILEDRVKDKELLRHLFEVREFVMRYDHEANRPQRVAALLHDLDRAEPHSYSKSDFITGISENKMREYQTYKSTTAWEVAVPRAEKILREVGASEEFIEETLFYVRHHDDKTSWALDHVRQLTDVDSYLYRNLRVLQAADCASFLRPENVEKYVENYGNDISTKLKFSYDFLEQEHRGYQKKSYEEAKILLAA